MTPKNKRPADTAHGKPSAQVRVVGSKKTFVPGPEAEEVKLPVNMRSFRAMLRKAPMAERVQIERHGVPCQVVEDLINEIGVSSTDFQRFVRIPKATFTKKMRDRSFFAGTPGQSVVGLMELINTVEDMLAAEKVSAEDRSFDVEKWVGSWLERPQPTLGGLAPAELMDTPTGRKSVMNLLGAMQCGAYQ